VKQLEGSSLKEYQMKIKQGMMMKKVIELFLTQDISN